jgi:hypothetical protein
MNRRSFFKFLGIGAATAAIAPKIAPKVLAKENSWTFFGYNPFKWTLKTIHIPGVKVSATRLKAHEKMRKAMDSQLGSGELKRNA